MNSEPVSVEILRELPLFVNLNETECRQLAEIISTMTVVPAEVILRQGERSQDLWIILEGTCEVIREVEQGAGDAVVLATIGPRNHFGEMSFFHPAPHSAHVRAKTAGKLLRIRHSDYQDLIDDGVWAAYKLAYNVVDSLAERLRRMDEWVTELLSKEIPDSIQPEWNNFREKLFTRWNL